MRKRQTGQTQAAFDWQRNGYRMEEAPCERAAAVNDANDTDYVLPEGTLVRRNVADDWHSGPFDDADVDPGSIQGQRNPDFNEHLNSFCDPEGPVALQKPEESQPETPPQRVPMHRANKHLIRVLAAVLAIVLAGAAVVVFGICTVKEIHVVGNSRVSEQDIIALSGIRLGTPLVSIRDDEAIAGVERNVYLTRVKVQKEFPNQVTIQVQERQQAAYINYCGILYVLDNRGMVLDESEDASARPALMRVEGLNVKSCTVGRRVNVYSETQLNTYITVLTELKAMGAFEEVSELYLNDTGSIYLATSDGYSVHLGDSDRVHEKIRAMLLTREQLILLGRQSGTIDVSTPEEPAYIPESGSA